MPEEMVALARRRLGDRAEVWCQDVLALEIEAAVDAVVSTAALHWVSDHDLLWPLLFRRAPGWSAGDPVRRRGQYRWRSCCDRRGRSRPCPRAHRLVALGSSPATADRTASPRWPVSVRPVWLAGGAANLPLKRRRIYPNLDPPRPPCTAAQRSSGEVCRHRRCGGCSCPWITCA